MAALPRAVEFEDLTFEGELGWEDREIFREKKVNLFWQKVEVNTVVSD